MAHVDNTIYENLGERWYEAWDDPVALLRAEGKLKHPWILERIRRAYPDASVSLLDVGCGAGFLTNDFSRQGLKVTGLDASSEGLRVAEEHDATKEVRYVRADALAMPFEDASFDVVTCLDFLEHVVSPLMVIKEISRVLRPGGLFFFHTFNRNLLSWLVVIKGVEWLVKNTPRNMHVIELFIKPSELTGYCARAGLTTVEVTGLRPDFRTFALRDLFSGVVPRGLAFTFTDSLLLSYLGYARKSV